MEKCNTCRYWNKSLQFKRTGHCLNLDVLHGITTADESCYQWAGREAHKETNHDPARD